MALAKIFAQEKGIDPGGVAAHDHVLIVIRKNLRLDEITRAKQFGDRAGFADRAQSALAIMFRIIGPRALQFLSTQLRNLGRIR